MKEDKFNRIKLRKCVQGSVDSSYEPQTGCLHQIHLLMERSAQIPSTGHTVFPEQFCVEHMLERDKTIN